MDRRLGHGPRGSRCAAGRAPARIGRVDPWQTTMPDYGCCPRPVELPRAARDPRNLSMNPGGPSAGAGAAGAGAMGSSISAPISAVDPPAAGWCGLVDRSRAWGPRADRPALYRPRRRSADTYCGRHCARYEGSVRPRLARRYQPAARRGRLGRRVPPKCAACVSASCSRSAPAWTCCPRCVPAVEAAGVPIRGRGRDHRAGQTNTHPGQGRCGPRQVS